MTGTMAKPLDELDVESGGWIDEKRQRAARPMWRRLGCKSGGCNVGWAVLATSQTIIILILATRLYLGATILGRHQRYGIHWQREVSFLTLSWTTISGQELPRFFASPKAGRLGVGRRWRSPT